MMKKKASISVLIMGFYMVMVFLKELEFTINGYFFLEEHIDRLFNSAKAIALEIPSTKDELCKNIIDTCKANDMDNGYIRLVVTRGKGTLGLNPYLCNKPEIIIITAKIQLYPEELYKNGLKIVTVGTVRNHPEAINPRIKSLNYLNNVLAKIEAINAGCLGMHNVKSQRRSM